MRSNTSFVSDPNLTVSPLKTVSAHRSNPSYPTGYESEANRHAALRDSLIESILSFGISTRENIQYQASLLARFTSMTNELTRKTIVRSSFVEHDRNVFVPLFQSFAADRCYQLSKEFFSFASEIPFEDAQMLSKDLMECLSHLSTVSAVSIEQKDRTRVIDV